MKGVKILDFEFMLFLIKLGVRVNHQMKSAQTDPSSSSFKKEEMFELIHTC